MAVQKCNDDNFAKVISGPTLTMIDFFATWCAPCKALSPVLEDLSNELKDKVTIYKLDIDESPNAPSSQAIRGVPTLKLFLKGALVDTKVGFTDRENLRKWIIANSG